ncbi:MBL fold metallo-hydrolase [Neptunomonas antarctica]|uniref:Ribonuclease BN, tRNA processing enzyme n=1 Tax=Neptunomonas antarctica TaxID=619304 RepID=A0A1N7IX55_9GAMM|nr:MBL fold metallo-hydrolase [Neptunomonas antarctica]SIS41692.1 Ribonuclease BN, tRNA processing enzyme [Neptunomonas antarctica]
MKPENEQISLLVLGVSGGAGHVYHGDCSSSFLILKNDEPLVLVDLGLGVIQALKYYVYSLPETVVITHNHTDHAGELPVVLRVEESLGRRLNIMAAAPVSERLQRHRMAEHAELYQPGELASWISPEPETCIPLVDDLSITFHAAQHSELCFGFVISRSNGTGKIPLIGYTGDSGYLPSLYEKISCCLVSIFDARPKGNQWHAGMEELDAFLNKCILKGHAYIIGHGVDVQNIPEHDRMMRPGQIIHIPEID